MKAVLFLVVSVVMLVAAVAADEYATTDSGKRVLLKSDGSWVLVDSKAKVKTSSGKGFEIVSVDTKVTETNSTWSRFAWKLTLKSNSGSPTTLTATIEWLDKDGFVIDDDIEYNIVLPAGAEKTFTGQKLIRKPGANEVKSINAKVGTR